MNSLIIDKYKNLHQQNFELAVKRYIVNYILVDLNDPQNIQLPPKFKQFPWLDQVAEINKNIIFKVR